MSNATSKTAVISIIAVVIMAAAIISLNKQKSGRGMVSCSGEYHVNTEKVYDGAKRVSDYLTLSEGTRLAYDLILPTKNGVAAEAHSWFDYWLKGIDNGILKEPPIHYYLQGVKQKEAYQTTDAWPLKNQKTTPYFFGAGATDGTSSVNNGTLVLSPPTVSKAYDTYTVDYTTTTGKKSHWGALASAHEYPNMGFNDAKALTYTTPLLETAVKVVGHPVAHIWLSSEARDLDVFAYLEEVDGKGNSRYVTQGNLRASHRILGQAPFDSFGLPWHNHFRSELKPVPAGEPIELVFDLLPTAYSFSKGKHIRITIAFSDSDNFDTPILRPAPEVRLLRDTAYASFVELPIILGHQAARSSSAVSCPGHSTYFAFVWICCCIALANCRGVIAPVKSSATRSL